MNKPGTYVDSDMPREDADDAVLLLDGAKDDDLARTLGTPLTPDDAVALQAIAEIALVHLVENVAQIEIATLAGLGEFELTL